MRLPNVPWVSNVLIILILDVENDALGKFSVDNIHAHFFHIIKFQNLHSKTVQTYKNLQTNQYIADKPIQNNIDEIKLDETRFNQ